MSKNLGPQEFVYDRRGFTRKEKGIDVIKSILLVLFFSFFFYRSVWAMGILLPVGFFYYKKLLEDREEKRRREVSTQFQECLQSIATNLRAGYSIENAFLESIADMKLLFGENGFIVRELRLMKKGIKNNISLETLLLSFGDRSQVTAIKEFGELFLIAKRGGGNMIEIIGSTATLIQEKMEVDRQIDILLSAKKMEQNIMECIPFVIILYVGVTSRGFFDVLYHNPLGIVVMSVCLILYIISYMMAEKIMKI